VKKVKDKTILERIKETPIVDKDKLNAFKEKLANNHFTINAQSIADKLLSLEDDIFRPLSAKTEK
ncbi:MAG: flagellar biosynthesis anti-sigma factor FlgM, partial [Candidatus Berkiella sp.]